MYLYHSSADKVGEGKEEWYGIKMSTHALNEAPEIWGPSQAIFLFSHQLEIKKQSASSTGTARTAREREEEEGGILHPGFCATTLAPSFQARDAATAQLGHGGWKWSWWRIFLGKWLSRKKQENPVSS